MDTPNIIRIVVMILVGAVCGGLASRIMSGANSGFLINTVLGIAGAVVGGWIFNLFGIEPGSGIVRSIYDTFGVKIPQNIVGMILSGTIGAILIILAVRMLTGRKGRARR